MKIEELNEILKKERVTKNYLVRDQDIIRSGFDRNSISFKKAEVLEDIEGLNTNVDGIEEDILTTVERLKNDGYQVMDFSVCGGLVVQSDGHSYSYVDDLFLYRLIIYPLEEVKGEYKRIPSSSNGVYVSDKGKIERIIHYKDLLTILDRLNLLPNYLDTAYFDILNKGFLSSGKPILFRRVLKKN